MLTIREITTRYNVSDKTLRRWIKQGLRAGRDNKGRYTVDEQELIKFLASRDLKPHSIPALSTYAPTTLSQPNRTEQDTQH